MITSIEAQLTKELRANPNLGDEARNNVIQKYTDRINRVIEKRDKFEKETQALN
jgi:hypothetical protein